MTEKYNYVMDPSLIHHYATLGWITLATKFYLENNYLLAGIAFWGFLGLVYSYEGVYNKLNHEKTSKL